MKEYKLRVSLSIYYTHTHSLGCMSEREVVGTRERLMLSGDHLIVFWGFTFGADSISEEVVGFSPFMVSPRKNIVFIVSCFLFLCLLFSQLKILI